jgi:hypothetical protein
MSRGLVDYYNDYLHDKEIKEYVDKYVKCHGLLDAEYAVRVKAVQEYIDYKKGAKR